ncbi:hypothetical protein F4604DRAFT_1736023 [Suillus subluteus]|nr:hypothetical protein F4604DRAFT_1736023 [Suillus subluteus]
MQTVILRLTLTTGHFVSTHLSGFSICVYNVISTWILQCSVRHQFSFRTVNSEWSWKMQTHCKYSLQRLLATLIVFYTFFLYFDNMSQINFDDLEFIS